MDLSYAAAHRLGYINNGSTLVEVESIIPGDTTTLAFMPVKPPVAENRDEIETLAVRLMNETPPSTARASAPPPSGVYLQLGAFSNTDNAESLRSHLARELDWLNEGIIVIPGGSLYRVQVGPYPNRSEAEKVAERIRLAYGQKPAFVTR